MRSFLLVSILLLFVNANISRLKAQECLPTRLQIAEEARVTPGAANRIRSESHTSSEQIGQIPAGDVVTLLAGPQCVDSFLWWRINYEGTEGWTVEASNTDYFLEPYADALVTAANSPENCDLETRLQIGGYGQVSSETPSRLRGEPGLRGDQIGQVDPSDVFRVLDGPVCADGFNWWQIQVNSLSGWLAEGDDETYYVELVADPAIARRERIAFAASWNADGSRLALSTSYGVFIYNTADLEQEPFLLDDGVIAHDVAFSPTDADLLIISDDSMREFPSFIFRAYRLSDEDETLMYERPNIEGPVGPYFSGHDFAFSADGTLLGFAEESFFVLETENWAEIDQVAIRNDVGCCHPVYAVFMPAAFSANSNYGAGVTDREIVNLFDLAMSQPQNPTNRNARITTLDRGGRTQAITAIEFSPDGSQLIAGDVTGSLQMWDLETGLRTSFIRADNQRSSSNRINDIAFHPDGELVATAESDPSGIVRVFAVEDLDTRFVFDADAAHVEARIVAYSPDGELLLTVMDQTLYVLDAADYTIISQVQIWGP